jgi:transcriptional regulator with XRE-family HTH domain
MRARRIAFGEVLRTRRRDLGLTQEELAEQIGSTRYLVNKVESGGYNLGWDRLCTLAEALGTELSDLFRAAEDNAGPHS